MAGGVVLSDEACPYKKWPYVRFVDNALPGEFYGMGECEILKDLQLELNKRRSQMVDHAALMGNAVWIISKDSDVDDDMISNKPGMIIFKNAGSEVRREPPPQMPNWIMQSIELTVRDMREVSGVSGIPGGQPPKGVRSGSGFQAANNIATIRIRAKGHNLEDAIEDAGAIIVSLMQQFYTPARFIQVTGASNQVYFIPWDGRAMQGDWDINIETGSTMSITKEAQGQQAIEMFKLKAIDNRALLERTNFPDAENILRRMGDQTVQTENPHYPGYPGPPHPDRTDTSGYSATVRHAVPSPAPGPMGGLVPQGKGGGGGQGPKPPPPPKPQQSSPTMGSSAPKGGGRGR